MSDNDALAVEHEIQRQMIERLGIEWTPGEPFYSLIEAKLDALRAEIEQLYRSLSLLEREIGSLREENERLREQLRLVAEGRPRVGRRAEPMITITLDDSPGKREGLVLRRMLQRAEESLAAQEKYEAKLKRRRGLGVSEMLRDEARAVMARLHAELTDQGVSA